VSKLSKSALQPLIDKMVDWLPAWQGRLMHQSGRLTLIKTTLVVIPVYTAMSFHLPLVPQGHDKDLQSVLVDRHEGYPWREVSGSLDQGVKTSPSQQAGSHGL
jgi:hypothetical protein